MKHLESMDLEIMIISILEIMLEKEEYLQQLFRKLIRQKILNSNYNYNN